MRSVSSLLAHCWARHAISRSDARVKREQRAFGVESFPLSRGGEKRKQRGSERRKEIETRKKRERERQTGRRSKPTHLECKSAGKKNKLGGSNNKEICFSSNTRIHASAHVHTVRVPLLFLLDVSLSSRVFL